MNGGDEEAEAAEAPGEGLAPAPGGELLHRPITGAILGAFYTVHSELGAGFLETVYANALTVLLGAAGLRFDREVPFEIVFHGHVVGRYRADLIVESRVVVEVKAGRAIEPFHAAQLLNYLRASRLEVGLLLNFGPSAQLKRIISSHSRSSAGRIGARKTGDAEDADYADGAETPMKQVAPRPSGR